MSRRAVIPIVGSETGKEAEEEVNHWIYACIMSWFGGFFGGFAVRGIIADMVWRKRS